jgi:hypothetical protein
MAGCKAIPVLTIRIDAARGDCGGMGEEARGKVGGILPTVRIHDPRRLLIAVLFGFSRGTAGFANRQMLAIVFVLIRTFRKLTHLIQLDETVRT